MNEQSSLDIDKAIIPKYTDSLRELLVDISLSAQEALRALGLRGYSTGLSISDGYRLQTIRLEAFGSDGNERILCVEARFFHSEKNSTPTFSLAVVDDDDNSIPLFLYAIPGGVTMIQFAEAWDRDVVTRIRDEAIQCLVNVVTGDLQPIGLEAK